jgi:membrane protease YdiL (CAAX protease family)
MRDRIRTWQPRRFFLVITLSFAYYIGVARGISFCASGSSAHDQSHASRIATEAAILLVVAWILHIRGWTVSRLTGRSSLPAVLAGIPLFMAYYFFYAGVVVAISALFGPIIANVRFVASAPVLLMLVFILVNSVFEEALVTGYVVTALSEQGAALAITASALLRLLYHLYQGPVASLAILPLGLMFAAVFWKWRTLWPLIAAHTLANVVALLGSTRG